MSVYYYLGNVYILYLQCHLFSFLRVASLEIYRLQQLDFFVSTGTSTPLWPFVCHSKTDDSSHQLVEQEGVPMVP